MIIPSWARISPAIRKVKKQDLTPALTEKIERASTPVEKKIYQRLLSILQERAAELRGDTTALKSAR